MKKIIMCAISGLMLASMAGASQPTVGTGEKSSPQRVPKAALQELISQTTDEEIKAWIQNPEAQLAKSLLLHEQSTKWIMENAKKTPTTASLDSIRKRLAKPTSIVYPQHYAQGEKDGHRYNDAEPSVKEKVANWIKGTRWQIEDREGFYQSFDYTRGVNSVAPDFPW